MHVYLTKLIRCILQRNWETSERPEARFVRTRAGCVLKEKRAHKANPIQSGSFQISEDSSISADLTS